MRRRVKSFGMNKSIKQSERREFPIVYNKEGLDFQFYARGLLNHCVKHDSARDLLRSCRIGDLMKSKTWFLMEEYKDQEKYSHILIILFEGKVWCVPRRYDGVVPTIFEVSERGIYRFYVNNGGVSERIRLITKIGKFSSEELDQMSDSVDDNIARQLRAMTQ